MVLEFCIYRSCRYCEEIKELFIFSVSNEPREKVYVTVTGLHFHLINYCEVYD